MPAKRPTIISVIGILNIVLGSLGLLTNVCCGVVGLIFLKVVTDMKPPADPNLAQMFAQIKKQNEMQGNFGLQLTNIGMATVTGTLLLVCGIGFMKMKPWARRVGLVYGAIGLLWAIALPFIHAQVVGQTLEKVNEDIRAKTGQSNPLLESPAFANVALVMGLIFNLAYPVTMLILMLLPAVKTSLAGKDPLAVEAGDDVLEAGPEAVEGNEQ
jgi:hypothetical protein